MSISASEVASHGNFSVPVGSDLIELERIIAAVTDTLERHFYMSDPMTDAQELAIIMQSYRLYNRKGDASGIQAFADITARNITGLDKDVIELLDAKYNFA